MAHMVIDTGGSRSFPAPHPFTQGGTSHDEIVVFIGATAGAAYRRLADAETYKAVLIELGNECLGVHTGEERGHEGSNALGFARFRMGDADPTNLVELVKQPHTKPDALAAAKAALEGAGLVVAVCNDFPGRILDRLLRPYFNAVLRRLDERLATAEDMDTTLRLGLGYPEGPIALLHRTGLAAHHDVTQALYEALGDPAYAPARRAQVAKARETQS
jgi:3-hydroxybutyryl-CoA dehydrogenase